MAGPSAGGTGIAIGADELRALCLDALVSAGARADVATCLAEATVDAERRRKSAVGAAHLLDYLDALREGRLRGDPTVAVTRPRPGLVRVDADDGPAQFAVLHALEGLLESVRECGSSVLAIGRSYTAGELGWTARSLAERGLVALVTASSPPLMALPGSERAVTGTNPIAFAVPTPDGVRSFDQAASAAAWVRVRAAADAGEDLPPGVALDATGRPATRAADALDGALLPNGGVKGANLAVMSELLAVLAGGSFALDSPPFDRGDRPPRTGVLALVIDPSGLSGDFGARAGEHLGRLRAEHGVDLLRDRAPADPLVLPEQVLRALRAAA